MTAISKTLYTSIGIVLFVLLFKYIFALTILVLLIVGFNVITGIF